jgi:hypothetical protein
MSYLRVSVIKSQLVQALVASAVPLPLKPRLPQMLPFQASDTSGVNIPQDQQHFVIS